MTRKYIYYRALREGNTSGQIGEAKEEEEVASTLLGVTHGA